MGRGPGEDPDGHRLVDPAFWRFNKPFYVLLNTAVAGAWGGQHGIDDGIFPLKYFIDYVRYYEWE